MFEAIIIVSIFVISIIISFICGKVSGIEPSPRCCLECLHEHNHSLPFDLSGGVCCNHYEIGGLRNNIQELNNKIYVRESKIRQLEMELENRSIDRYFRSCEEKSNWLNKDLCATKKQAEEKIEELQKIIKKI